MRIEKITRSWRGPGFWAVLVKRNTRGRPMANYPKKLMDPTEAALSAIQEALNVRDDEERQAPPPDESELPLAHSADAMAQTEPATPAFDEAIDLDDIDTRDTRGPRMAEPLPFHA